MSVMLPAFVCRTFHSDDQRVCRLESTAGREDSNAQIVQQLRQGAEERLQAMDAAVSSSLLQQQELYSTIQHMTSQFMQQKNSDLAAMQVSSRLIGNACTCIAHLAFQPAVVYTVVVCWLCCLDRVLHQCSVVCH